MTYLITYGTRPEIIKLFPIINECEKRGIPHKTLFTGQHKDLFEDMEKLIPKPDYTLTVMEHGQSLNKLISKIISQVSIIFENNEFDIVFVQGDTTSALGIALASFYTGIKVAHVEAGLRTYNLASPYPEEGNRQMISRIAEYNFCPTQRAVENLSSESICKKVVNVGNTSMDACKHINNMFCNCEEQEMDKYFVITLHRRENRGDRMIKMWKSINQIAKDWKDYSFIYINHPSITGVEEYLTEENIKFEDPLICLQMRNLLNYCTGFISDSGGIQEECAYYKKKVLVCRNTTERPESVECGVARLVDDNICSDHIHWLIKPLDNFINPYGNADSSEKILDYLETN